MAEPADPDPLTVSIELVHRAQGGERDALNRLFDRYQDRVLRIIRARMGPRARRVAESVDILQETFAAAVRDFDRFEVRDEASLIYWLSRIAHLRILEANRRARRAAADQPLGAAGAESSSGDAGLQLPADGPTPSEEVADLERDELFLRCLHQLREEDRELILLRTYAKAPWETVARVLGRPSASAARMAHTRLLVVLAKCMARARD